MEVRKVRVNAEFGTVCWPNGADLDSDVLDARLTGRPIRTRAALAGTR